jgi:hypothetical protein
VDVRPEDDRRHHLDGAIAGRIRGVEDASRTFASGAVAGSPGDRVVVRAWIIAPPAAATVVAAACEAAGAAMRPTLVAAGLVDETLRPASAAWTAALAATSSGGAVRLVAKPHAMGNVEIVLPERIPATGMVADLAAILEGAELTPDRLFVVKDVVEASIVLVDRLVEGLPKKETGKQSQESTIDHKAKARRTAKKPAGRPRSEPDKHIRKLVKDITAEIRREGMDPGKELPKRLFSKTSGDLSAMLHDRYRVDVPESTIRTNSEHWKRWVSHRKKTSAAGSGSSDEVVVGQDVHGGGAAVPTAEDRKTDATTAAWLSKNGFSLD